MALPSLFRWGRGRDVPVRVEEDPVGAFRHEMNRLFDDFGRGFGLTGPGEGLRSFTPSVDLEETEDQIQVHAELPGLEEKDLEVSVERDHLILRGEKRRESEERQPGGWTRSERSYGSFERVVPLPCEVEAEQAKATFRNGVLTVSLPKPAEAQRRRVAIPVRSA